MSSIVTTPGSPDGFSPSPAGAAAGAAHARGRSSDAFEDEDFHQAHFNGEVAQALAQNAELFADAPSIHQVGLLASK